MASCNIISLIGYIRRHLLITLRNYYNYILIILLPFHNEAVPSTTIV